MQTAAPGVYTGAIDVVKKTLARDGMSGYLKHLKVALTLCSHYFNRMYRGMVPPLLGVTPIFAVSFWVRHDFAYKSAHS